MANGDGQRVGGVRGLGDLGEPQQARDHLLHLRLFRPAVAHHRRLDGQRRVLADFQSGGGGGQHRHPAHLTQLQRGLHVDGVEDVLDGNQLRLVRGD